MLGIFTFQTRVGVHYWTKVKAPFLKSYSWNETTRSGVIHIFCTGVDRPDITLHDA